MTLTSFDLSTLPDNNATLDLIAEYLPKLRSVPGLDPLMKDLIATHRNFLRDAFSEAPTTELGGLYKNILSILSSREMLSQSGLKTVEVSVLIQSVALLRKFMELNNNDAHSIR
jgi:hypothetical protein